MPPKVSKFKNLLQDLNVMDNKEDNTLLTNLLKVPKKDKRYENATAYVPTANYMNQVDTLFLPSDDYVPPAMKNINQNYLKKVNPLRVKDKKKVYTKESLASTVLSIGTPVRIQLDHPVNVVDDKKLSGVFRA